MAGWLKREVCWPEDPVRVAGGLSAGGGELAWLDSSDAGPGGGLNPPSSGNSTAGVTPFAGNDTSVRANPPAGGRWSLLAWRPITEVSQTVDLALLTSLSGDPVPGETLWSLLRAHPSLNVVHEPTGMGLSPGWIGFIGFAAARTLERVHCRVDPGEVVARLALYDRGVVIDHGARRVYGLVSTAAADAEDALERLAGEWAEACERGVTPAPGAATLRRTVARGAFEAAVRRAKEYIAAGDIYQVNLAHRIELAVAGDWLAAYRALRAANPAAYGAFLRWGDRAIASVSPELFLDVRAGRVRTGPIKGTRALTGEAAADDARVRELLRSEKDAAELAMIVDLHRNDLGRVCRPGGVRVVEARRVERIPAVVHTVADIEGELAPGRDALDALMASFPAGSVSGVPKIRAIDIIAELEPTARGAYTGAIGVLGLDGTASLSVAIRTVQVSGVGPAAGASLHVGAGIVADSDPAAEYEETLAKARRILAALGAEITHGAKS